MKDKILEWYENKNINPYTKRKIKENGVTYKKLMKLYNKFILENNNINNIKNKSEPSPLDSIEDLDILNLSKIWEIVDGKKIIVHENPENLITYEDENKNIHSFEKESIQYLKDYNIEYHPITKVRIPKEVFNKVNIELPKLVKTNDELALEITQLLTHNSFFINKDHIIKLESKLINKLYYECCLFFKDNIPNNIINQIREEFDVFNIDVYTFENLPDKMNYLLNCFKMILEYDNDMVKIMSCHIIIGGLSIVNKDIKKLYPDFNFSFI